MIRRLALAATVSSAACSVDLGPMPDSGRWGTRADYFVSDVWPRYLVANQCAARGCHDFTDGHGTLRLRRPEAAPAAGTTVDLWPLGWRENYLSTVQLLRCDEPLASRLLTVPEVRTNLHPPGPIVLDRQAAAKLIESWLAP